MRNFYVYAYLDISRPGSFVFDKYHFDFEPFYIGKGNGRRYLRRMIEARKGLGGALGDRIRSIGQPLIVTCCSSLLEKAAFEQELFLIKVIGRIPFGPLLNLTAGGEGVSGYIMSAVLKKHISERAKVSQRLRYKNKSEREKTSVALKDYFNSPGARKKHGEDMSRVWSSKERRQRLREKQLKRFCDPAFREFHRSRLCGRTFSFVARKNMGIARKKMWIKRRLAGFRFSAEAIKNMTVAARRRGCRMRRSRFPLDKEFACTM